MCGGCSVAQEGAKADATSSGAGGGGRGRRRQINHHAIAWDWDSCRLQIVAAVAGVVSRLNLWALFRPAGPPEALLLRFSHLGQWALREPLLARDAKSREAAFHLLCATGLKYQQLDGMTAPLVNLLSDHEHLPPVFADLAAFAASTYEDTRLVRGFPLAWTRPPAPLPMSGGLMPERLPRMPCRRWRCCRRLPSWTRPSTRCGERSTGPSPACP